MVFDLGPDDPERIGPYMIVGVLGQGGMGRVYLGKRSGTKVAIKVIRANDALSPEARTRFMREIEAMQRVQSDQVAQVVGSATSDTTLWYASEYIEGSTLQAAVENGKRFVGGELARLVTDLYAALRAIHGAGIVHRDLKPSNVMLGEDGVRVIDFGIAFSEDQTKLTKPGSAIGTCGYMSPEQLNSDTLPSASWDVFAFGCVIAYASSGRRAFAALPLSVLTDEPDLRDVPDEIRPLVEKCLQKDRRNRATLDDIARLMPVVEGSATETLPARPEATSSEIPTFLIRGRRAPRTEAPDPELIADLFKRPRALQTAPYPQVPPTRPDSGVQEEHSERRCRQPRKRWVKLVRALVALLVVLSGAAGIAKVSGYDFEGYLNPPLDWDIPQPVFTPVALKSGGNPAITDVQVQGRNLNLTVKFTGNKADRTSLPDRSCLLIIGTDKDPDGTALRHTRIRTFSVSHSTAGDVFEYWGALDYPGSFQYLTSCGDTSGTQLGSNQVKTPGLSKLAASGRVIPVIAARANSGVVQVLVRHYQGDPDGFYAGMCLVTNYDAEKPTVSKRGRAENEFVILTFVADSGTFYPDCTRTPAQDYVSQGVKVP